MDTVAQSVLELTFSQNALPPIANLVHPRPIAWTFMISSVCEALQTLASKKLSIVPFADWFTSLETHSRGATRDDIARIVSCLAVLLIYLLLKTSS